MAVETEVQIREGEGRLNLLRGAYAGRINRSRDARQKTPPCA